MTAKSFIFILIATTSLYSQENLGFKKNLQSEVNELESFTNAFFKSRQLNTNHVLTILSKDSKGFMKSYPEHSKKFSELTSFQSRLWDEVFTNLSILHLHELEKLNLRSDISNYKIKYDRKFKQNILIENILTHTTGLQEKIIYTDGKKKRALDFYTMSPLQRFSEPSQFIGHIDYSSDLLKIILTEISGVNAEELIKSEIFSKLNLENTSYENSLLMTNGKDIEKLISVFSSLDLLETTGILKKNTIKESLDENFREEDKLPGTVIGFFEHYENGLWGYSRVSEVNSSTEELIFFPDKKSALYLYSEVYDPEIRKEFIAEYLDYFHPVEKISIKRDKSQGYAEYLENFEGEFSPVQISKVDISKFKRITSSIRIIQENGILILNSQGKDSYGDLSERMEFIETDPFLFRSPDWEIYISFKMDEEGDVQYLLSGAGQHGAYKKLDFYETSHFHKNLTFIFIGFYVLTFLFLVGERIFIYLKKLEINSNRIRQIIDIILWFETILILIIFSLLYYFIEKYKLLEVNQFMIERSLFDYITFTLPYVFVFGLSVLTYFTIKGLIDSNLLIYKKIQSLFFAGISFILIYWMGYWNLFSFGF